MLFWRQRDNRAIFDILKFNWIFFILRQLSRKLTKSSISVRRSLQNIHVLFWVRRFFVVFSNETNFQIGVCQFECFVKLQSYILKTKIENEADLALQ